MDKITLIKIIIALLIVTLSFIGLNVTMYSWRTKKFYVNYFLVFWCITVILTFSLVYISRLHNEIITEEFDLANVLKLSYYMSIIGAVITFIAELINSKAAVDFFNQVQLFETLQYLDIEFKAIKSMIFFLVLKTIIFPMVIEITLILRQLHEDVDEKRSLLLTIYILYPLVIANIIPNCLFGVFVICRELISVLNHHLSTLEKEANFLQMREQMQLHKRFYRMQKFCNLADKLDELSERYSLICCQELNYMNLCAISLLVSLLCNLFGITVAFSRQYYALADTLINEESYDVLNALTSGVFLVISFLEIFFHSLVANQNINAAKETGLILKRIRLDNTDIRFRQAVESFSFKILVINFKIQPMKLLDIDLGLMHSVLSAVTSFLLILIQSDLTLRFSLK